ncbi:hypothetical protein N7512_001091 [Penicillium capsulatum]|nr:hypothetical protein N7512_001091 [Penicillium capsulatum]
MYPSHELPVPMAFLGQTFQQDESFDGVYILPSTAQSMNSYPTDSCAMPSTNNLFPTDHHQHQHHQHQTINDGHWLAVPSFNEIPPYHNMTVGINDMLPWGRYSHPAPSPQPSQSDCSSTSAFQPSNDLAYYGTPTGHGTWRCSYPGCSSKTVFHRGCDLRKHYKRHGRHFFCRHPGCPKSTSGGFSSRKDRGRHEAKHNPSIQCGWEGCPRIFSRMDNMRDHVRRVHQKKSRAR